MARVSTEVLQGTKKLQETRGFTRGGTLCQQGQTHTGQTLAGSACLRTLVSERALAGLAAAWNDEACLSGDKKGPSYTRWPGVLGW